MLKPGLCPGFFFGILRLRQRTTTFLLGIFTVLFCAIPTRGATQLDHNQLVLQAKSACAPFVGRKLTLLVPFKAGGGFDLTARALEPTLAEYSGMQVSVSNVTGGAGVLAIRTVINAKADKPVVGLIDLGASAAVVMEDKSGLALSDLRGLGVISVEHSVWITKKPIDWQQSSGKPLLAATATNPFLRFGLPSHSMNFKTRAVYGYQGTSDTWLAMLRGEVDAVSMSDQSALRNLATGADARVSLILSDRPHPDFPGIPHLAGSGGMVDMRTKGMSESDRKRLISLGALAAMLSDQARTLVASAKLRPEVLTCLRLATEAALFDPALADIAKRQKFGLNPGTSKSAQANIEKIATAISDHEKDLRLISAQWKKGH